MSVVKLRIFNVSVDVTEPVWQRLLPTCKPSLS